MAKALMIQGTGSGAGKSAIVAGLCRIFRDMGIRVAPFKAQNMALNSFITKEGGEIGRAQAFQAEAAGIEPCNDMNPVLLKATGEAVSQVIFNGKVYANMKAEEYYAIKDKAWDVVAAAYKRLSEQYDLIVIEGAGSPAEINLREEEIVNMSIARHTNAAVILVGDIDKGGVFASLYGTVELLKDNVGGVGNMPFPLDGQSASSDADFIKAFIINKFRGNIDILRPGLRMIEHKTGKLVIGVIPHGGNLGLDEEDGLAIESFRRFDHAEQHKQIKIVVLRLKYIANFTDFAPFLCEQDVEFKYSLWEEDITTADLVIIPGSKNTVSDLLFLRERGLDESLKSAVANGTQLAGICGGYQMLGTKIIDPHNVENSLKEVDGMGLLDIVTTLDKTKTTCQISAELINRKGVLPYAPTKSGEDNKDLKKLNGYEIHMGNTTGDVGLFKINRLNSSNPSSAANDIPDGSAKDNVWGTYIHGIFDNDEFRSNLLNSLREKKGLPLQDKINDFHEKKQEAIDNWADVLRDRVDMCFILRQVGMESFHQVYCRTVKHG